MDNTEIEFLINAVKGDDFDDEICDGLLRALRELKESNTADGPVGIGALSLIISSVLAGEREECARIAERQGDFLGAHAIRARADVSSYKV